MRWGPNWIAGLSSTSHRCSVGLRPVEYRGQVNSIICVKVTPQDLTQSITLASFSIAPRSSSDAQMPTVGSFSGGYEPSRAPRSVCITFLSEPASSFSSPPSSVSLAHDSVACSLLFLHWTSFGWSELFADSENPFELQLGRYYEPFVLLKVSQILKLVHFFLLLTHILRGQNDLLLHPLPGGPVWLVWVTKKLKVMD